MTLQLSSQALDWALNHAQKFGYVEFFPPAFEFEAIKHDWANVRVVLENADLDTWAVRPARRCLSPKGTFSFRVSTQLDPLDFLVYTALAYEMGAAIEARRVPAGDRVVYSYRFAADADGTMYDDDYTYSAFVRESSATAKGGSFHFVVIADIADFYPRLYEHRLENALRAMSDMVDHTRVLIKLLKQWNEKYSYGVPVGVAASRILAEAAIDDVDKYLLAENIKFLRYSDDYRLFCKSEVEAYKALAILAETLFENHGLTLQSAKTQIVPVAEFLREHSSPDDQPVADSLVNHWREIMESIGVVDDYEDLKWDELNENTKQEISRMNLETHLIDQASASQMDIPLTRFLLHKLGQIDSETVVDRVLDDINKFYVVFNDVIGLLRSLRSLSPVRRAEIGKRILEAMDGTRLAHLEYHRMWALHLFGASAAWDNSSQFVQLLSKWTDSFAHREIVLALGRSKADYWFRSQKRRWGDHGPWVRRAILAGASCLPPDERKHWYESVKARLDPLEAAVVSWARANPFSA